jgi:hypothetical protein
LLHSASFKEDFDAVAGAIVHLLDVEETDDGDPRYEQPGVKTLTSRRQLLGALRDELSTADRAEIEHLQVAPAGQAVRRILEATGILP